MYLKTLCYDKEATEALIGETPGNIYMYNIVCFMGNTSLKAFYGPLKIHKQHSNDTVSVSRHKFSNLLTEHKNFAITSVSIAQRDNYTP